MFVILLLIKQRILKKKEDKEIEQDNAELLRKVEMCGLPFETAIFNEEGTMNDVQVSIAPAEGSKPIPLLTDEHFESLSNPDKFPDGKNALSTKRKFPLDVKRYFNQRILDVDGRFAKSIDYLFSAQYAVENRQVKNEINHYVFRRMNTREFQGRKINTGFLKNSSNMKHLVKSDYAFKALKNVRGSPAYYQTMFYDVCAMVRQLGIPTWFMTLSSADILWPDMIQTIARQYGHNFSDLDVKNMSSSERFKWLRTNPVTAARHFQYRLDIFFSNVLKSTADPIGHVIDYASRIEFQARGSPHAHMLIWIKKCTKSGC